MTDDELDRLDSACKAATPGPWIVGPEKSVGPYGDTGYDLEATVDGEDGLSLMVGTSYGQGFARMDDAIFIATAREMVPRLIAEVRRLKAMEGRT